MSKILENLPFLGAAMQPTGTIVSHLGTTTEVKSTGVPKGEGAMLDSTARAAIETIKAISEQSTQHD